LVYVVSDTYMNGGGITTLTCLNTTTGGKIWSLTELLTKFTVSNGYLYASYWTLQREPCTTCLNASTGVQIWNFSAGSDLGKPAVKDGVVYVGESVRSKNGEYAASYMFALDASTGKVLWRYTTPSGSDLGSIYIDRAPLVVGNNVCAIDSNGLFVLNTREGNLKWNYITTNLQSINYANGIIYTSRYDDASSYTKGEVIAFNITSGEKLWNYYSSDVPKIHQTGDYYTLVSPISKPVLTNTVMLVATQNGEVTALNPSNGSTMWQYQLNTPLWQATRTTTPATSTESILVNSPSTAYAISLEKGELLWQHTIGNTSINLKESYPTYDNGVVYVGSNAPSLNDEDEQHNFYALNAANGKEIWHYTVDRNMLSTPVIDNGTVYFGGDSESARTFNNKNPILYALKTATVSTQDNNDNDYRNSWILITSIVTAILAIIAIVILFKKRKNRLLHLSN
ncbi:MAG TPA: PQQ-binding-like beta-propeller repeat protein, partial [Candidatus Acidoferrales bacterium]|nr:PQQ-binding-like beta-propeller repeat protein [Candidatus Acidoferrales bacterium]